MSMPEFFSVFSPQISFLKKLTPEQYLAATRDTLEMLPQWQILSAFIATVSLGILLGSLALSFIIDEDQKPFEEQKAIGQVVTVLIGFSAITFTISVVTFGAIPKIYTPILNNRIEWLQAGLNRLS